MLKNHKPTKLISRLVLFAGLSFLIFPVFGQKTIRQSNQVWVQSYNEAKLSDRWTALLDGGLRWDKDLEISVLILRGGVGYSLSPNVRVAGGFAFLGTFEESKIIRNEYRPFQELTYRSELGKLSINNRLRLEERFFESKPTDINRTSFNFRFRYAIMLGIPLANLSRSDPKRRLILNMGDEIFINAGKEITHRVFDQNRIILSPTVQWNKNLSVSFTYNSQFGSTALAETFVHSHIFWLQTRYNLDFSH